ncbi:unnamed protein product, partial [Brassica oleracea]
MKRANREQEPKQSQTRCAIEHQRQATRRHEKQTDGTTTDENLSATTPGELEGGPQSKQREEDITGNQ